MEDQPLINPSIDMNTLQTKELVISDQDKENFFKSILADKPYEEEVTLFDGQLTLKFKAMTVQENTDVVNQITLDRRNNTASDTDAYFVTIATYRLALSLATIDGLLYSNITREGFSSPNEGESYVLAKAKPMTQWSTPKLSICLDAFSRFESKLVKLSSEVQTRNFWKASA